MEDISSSSESEEDPVLSTVVARKGRMKIHH